MMNSFNEPRTTIHNSQHGIVLLFVLGVLALLSVLAIAFVQMTRIEKAISRDYVDRTRALMAAESGIEYAIGRINQFRGGVLTADELAALTYPTNTADPPTLEELWDQYSKGLLTDEEFMRLLTYPPTPTAPDLDKAETASFQMPGVDRAMSGVVGNTYKENGDIFDDIANTLTYAGGSPVAFKDSGGMPLQFRYGDSFKFRVYFNVAPDQTLYESPVLDDITFTVNTAKPKILLWLIQQ
ncbi:PilX N-terminal domain-containing pilus assembly protein [Planctomycetota bacterium]